MDVAINYWAVLAAAVGNMIIGFLWFGPVFGKMWKEMMGFTDESMKKMVLTPVQAMILGFIAALVMVYVFAHMLVYANAYTHMSGLWAGVQGGLWLWLGFIAPVTVGIVLWEGKSWKLWVLTSGYWLVSLAVMGAILGAWM